jgi:hypothetical protein
VKKHVEKERTVNITENKICGTFSCYVDPNNNYECVLDIHNTTSNTVCSKNDHYKKH